MVTAPLLTVGVEVDLPKTEAGQINADAAPLVVSIKADGALYLQEAEIDSEALIPGCRRCLMQTPTSAFLCAVMHLSLMAMYWGSWDGYKRLALAKWHWSQNFPRCNRSQNANGISR